MSADFWAGSASGAIGILVGNPLDIVKTQLQAGSVQPRVDGGDGSTTPRQRSERWTSYARGAAAPILGYGALNALLFVTYNRSLAFLNTDSINGAPENPSAWSIWTAGALGGLATFAVSAPTELVKCRAQVCVPPKSSVEIARETWRTSGLRGLYLGGGITSLRDAIGYGFYFWSYELSKNAISDESDSPNQQALKVLICGGLAGVVTWTSVFPLDVMKTRVQVWSLGINAQHSVPPNSTQPLLRHESSSVAISHRPSLLWIAQDAYRQEGISVFFKGLGVCNVRAFFVNAVQWAVYEWTMKMLGP